MVAAGTITKRLLKTSGKKLKYSYGYSFFAGRDENGKRIQVTKKGFATKGEAQDALNAALKHHNSPADQSAVPEPPAVTLNDLLDEYLAVVEGKVTRKTFETYQREAKRVRESIGAMSLASIDTIVIEDYLNDLKKPPHSYSVKSIRNTAGVLSGAFRLAIRRTRERPAYLAANPMVGVQLPSAPRRKVEALSRQDVLKVLGAAQGTDLYEVIALALGTGMRRGELLGLHWEDVDLEARQITVRYSVDVTSRGLSLKPPKSGQVRFVPIPPSLVKILEAHRNRQHARQAEQREMFGEDFQNRGLVFAAPDGGLLHPDNVGARVRNLCSSVGVKVGLHAFRHQHASEQLSSGTTLATISKRLGHASPAITASIYSHGLDEDDMRAADRWEKSFGGVFGKASGECYPDVTPKPLTH